ncbi:MAG: ABC transporter permease [Bacteroidales bacterium]|nr:ABC transporter permease [Bacteroidales bacterium]
MYTVIVIGGLSLGITTFLSIIQWTEWHVGFDKHIANGDNIYRVSLLEQREGFERHTARMIHGDVVRQLYNVSQITDILDIGRLAPFRNAIVRKDEIVFYEDKSFACDPEFLKLFQPEMLVGNPESVLNSPYKIILSETTAKKYFGNNNPVGKTLEMVHQFGVETEEYEITGVFKDFPDDTHFNIELLTSFDNPKTYNSTAWVYMMLADNTNISELEKQIKDFITENNDENYSKGLFPSVIPLYSIHMKSHLARELEQNVNRQTIFILFIAGMLVFVLAWFNFTLLSISQNQLNLKKLIYQWQLGSGKKMFFNQFFTEFLTVGIISFVIALILSLLANTPIKNTFGISLMENKGLMALGVGTILLILILSSVLTSLFATQRLYRTIKQKYFSNTYSYSKSGSSGSWFIRAVIIAEFIITFILISNLLMIRTQVNYSISQQIGSNDSTTIQIPNLPRPVIDNYSVFRDELKKYPIFEEVTAMMEEPGGMSMDAFGFRLEGIPANDGRLFVFPVDENFIRFYDLDILAGNDFPAEYNLNDTTEYYILNESAAKLFEVSSYDELLGRELNLDFVVEGIIYPGELIGVVEDFHLSSMEREIDPMVIFPEYTWLYCFSLRIKGDTHAAIEILSSEWKEFFPEYPLRYSFTTDMYQELYETELTEIRVLIIFSILSILIAGTGLFALSGFFMQQKMHAASIRKIHGARMIQILVPELLHYLYLAIISTIIAVPISWLSINKWLSHFSYQADVQLWVYPLIGLFLIVFAWIAVFYHAIRLARMNPTDLIQSD